MRKTYALLGGDQRQLYLGQLLRQDGNLVYLWGFDRVQNVEQTSLEQAVTADVVILPLPVSQDGLTLYLPLSVSHVQLEELWPLLDSRHQLICGGNIKESVLRQAAGAGVTLVDYFAREEVQVGNAVPTAEGAIQTAMEAMERTLHGTDTLVIGYGRIGKVLVQDLLGLGAAVTVSARKFSDLAWIEAAGCQPVQTEKLAGRLKKFSLIFNTVPAPVLPRARLEELEKSCLVIDLAAEPGGVDFVAADALGITAIWARALPGRTAPLTAAEVLRSAVYHILEERGEPI